MPDFQLNYSGEQVNTAIGNGLNAITTESGQVLTTDQQQVVQQKIGLPKLFSHTAPPIIETVNGSVVSVADASDQNAVSLISHIEPVQEGEGDPSPDNVRPISGWDAVNIWQAGTNLLQPLSASYTSDGVTFTPQTDGSVILNGTKQNGEGTLLLEMPFLVVKGLTYFISIGDYTNTPIADFGLKGFGTNKTILYNKSNFKSAGINLKIQDGETLNNVRIYPKISFVDGLPYEPYNGKNLTAELPETVYGGEKNWTTGVLQPEYKKTVFNGDEDWKMYSTSNGNGFFIELEGFSDSKRQVLSDKLKYIGEFGGGSSFLAAANIGECCTLTGSPRFYVKSDATTVDDFKANLTSDPVTVVHSCNTMQPIQLAPQQITLLKGTNNVWSDTGDTELSYVADTKLYINNQIASIATTAQNS